jgi:hypothetical protein
VTFTADVPLLSPGIDESLARELITLLERDPEHVADQIRAWMADEELV